MEEKERYELVEEDFAYAIVDNEEHKTYQNDCFDFSNICDLLNQQDKLIKALEEMNERVWCARTNADDTVTYLEQENQQLRMQLHDLPKKIVEEIKANNIYLNSSKPNQKDHIYDSYLIEVKTLNSILKKYGG